MFRPVAFVKPFQAHRKKLDVIIVQSRLCALLVAFLLLAFMTGCVRNVNDASGMHEPTKQTETNQKRSKYFKAVGNLNYEYTPGVILPLRNGKILALGGNYFRDEKPEKLLLAKDGKTYGFGWGMAELFDPQTGKTEVLTKLPYYFHQLFGPNRRQMQAVELEDGRIFMVGEFESNESHSAIPIDHAKSGLKDHYLPFYGKVPPKCQLRSIAPSSSPQMLGLLYDWRNHTCEVVNTPDEIPPRFMVTLNLLQDGRVLIMGGAISSGSDSGYYGQFPETRVLRFDPKTKKIDVVGNLTHTRYGHQTVPLDNHRFMLFGGWGVSKDESQERDCVTYGSDGHCIEKRRRQITRDVEVFDLRKGKSVLIGHTLSGRYDFSAIPLPDKTIFLHGGPFNSLLGFVASELYVLKDGVSVYVGEKPNLKPEYYNARGKPSRRLYGEGIDFQALLVSEKLLLVGEDLVFMYNWRVLRNPGMIAEQRKLYEDAPVVPRIYHHLIKIPSGRVFLIGGKGFAYQPMYGAARNLSKEEIETLKMGNVIEEFIYPLTPSSKE
jgi:hypothetical protein